MFSDSKEKENHRVKIEGTSVNVDLIAQRTASATRLSATASSSSGDHSFLFPNFCFKMLLSLQSHSVAHKRAPRNDATSEATLYDSLFSFSLPLHSRAWLLAVQTSLSWILEARRLPWMEATLAVSSGMRRASVPGLLLIWHHQGA